MDFSSRIEEIIELGKKIDTRMCLHIRYTNKLKYIEKMMGGDVSMIDKEINRWLNRFRGEAFGMGVIKGV